MNHVYGYRKYLWLLSIKILSYKNFFHTDFQFKKINNGPRDRRLSVDSP